MPKKGQGPHKWTRKPYCRPLIHTVGNPLLLHHKKGCYGRMDRKKKPQENGGVTKIYYRLKIEHYVISGTFCDTSSFSWILLLSQGLFWSTVALEESYIKKHAGGFVCFNPSVSVLFCEFIFIVYPSELNTFAPVGCNFFNLWAKMCTTSGWSFLRCLCLVHKGVQWI